MVDRNGYLEDEMHDRYLTARELALEEGYGFEEAAEEANIPVDLFVETIVGEIDTGRTVVPDEARSLEPESDDSADNEVNPDR